MTLPRIASLLIGPIFVLGAFHLVHAEETAPAQSESERPKNVLRHVLRIVAATDSTIGRHRKETRDDGDAVQRGETPEEEDKSDDSTKQSKPTTRTRAERGRKGRLPNPAVPLIGKRPRDRELETLRRFFGSLHPRLRRRAAPAQTEETDEAYDPDAASAKDAEPSKDESQSVATERGG